MDLEQKRGIINELYHDYSDGIYQFILFIIKDTKQAEDLTHDTFLQAFKNIQIFEGRSSTKTWLYRIARNITVNYIRKQKSIKWKFKQLDESIQANDLLPESMIALQESERIVLKVLATLKKNISWPSFSVKLKIFP